MLSVLSGVFVFRSGYVAYCALGALCYGAAKLLPSAAEPGGQGRLRRWRRAALYLGLFCIAFLLARSLAAASGSHFHVVWVALFEMWAALRLVTFFWEVGADRVPCPSPLGFALWFLLPFTLLGPALRLSESQEFQRGVARGPVIPVAPTPAWWGRVLLASLRFALSIGAWALGQRWLGTATGKFLFLGKVANVFFFAPWIFYYFNAGLFSLLECFAQFWGLKLPPSFNAPFGRKNISEFWNNWNMTATRVFRDYVFMVRWHRGAPALWLNTLLVFVFCGAWHGLNGYWLLWGLLHGLGFWVYLAHKQAGRRRDAQAARPGGQASRLMDLAARVATYAFVCLCWYVPSKVIELLSRLHATLAFR